MRRTLAVLLVLAVAAPAAVGAQEENDTSTVRHEDPEAGVDYGNIEAVRAHLERRMGRLLVDCSESIGRYESCEDVDEEYREAFGRYVEVTDGSATDSGDRAEAYRDARRNQREYAATLREFNETRAEYREARAAGDDERARRLARKLRRLAADLDSVSVELARDLRTVEETSEVDTSDVRRSVNETANETGQTTVRIAREMFEPSTVTATVQRAGGSFRDPLVVSGRVTGNGSAIADARVELDAGGRVVATRTNETGGFRVRYRPTTAPAGNGTLTVRYVPRDESRFLGNDTALAVRIDRVAPRVDVAASETLGYGDPANVTGRVAVDDVGAPAVPVVVTVGGTRLGRVRTDANGSFALRAPLNASVAPGARRVRARVAADDGVLSNESATTRVTVRETPTALTLDAAAVDETRVRVRGRLATTDGRALPNRTVALRVDGGRRETVTTGPNGTFAATVAGGDGGQFAVTARFDGEGTNLGAATADTSVAASSGGFASQLPTGVLPGIVAALLVALVLAGVGWQRRSGTEAAAELATEDGGGADQQERDPGPDAGRLLARARERASDGASAEAVRDAYVAARVALGDRRPGQTHWEFYHDRREALGAEREGALRRLTEAYESAAFSPAGVARDGVEGALDAATLLAGGE